MECANTQALNKYQDKLKKQEDAFEDFLEENEDDIGEINEMISKLKKVAESYQGYDFEEEVKSLIEDMA